jgi:hypothetical protein
MKSLRSIKSTKSLTSTTSIKILKSLRSSRISQGFIISHNTEFTEGLRLDSFNVIAATLYEHYQEVLNFFNNRATNASAESLNAKIKAFRASLRGVTDIPFFMFRLTKIYA